MKILVAASIAVVVIGSAFFFLSSDEGKTAKSLNDKSLIDTQKNSVDTEKLKALFSNNANESRPQSNAHKYDEAGDFIQSDELVFSTELEARYQSISDNEQYPTLSSRMSALNSRRPDTNFSAENILAAMEKSAAWEGRAQPGPKLNKLTEEEINDGRQFLDFDPLKVETLMVGDHMDVTLDSIGQVFDMKVDSVRIYEDGNVKWKGTITNGDGGSVTITQSEALSIVAVVLREDDYTLEAHGSDGWIVDSGTLFKVDPEHTDQITLK